MVADALSAQPVPPPTTAIPNTDLEPARENAAPVPLSYAIKELQRTWFDRLNSVQISLFSGVGATGWNGNRWRADKQIWYFESPPSVALRNTPLWPQGSMSVEFLYNGSEPQATYEYADEIIGDADDIDYQDAQWVCLLSKSPVSITIDDSQTVTVLEERTVTVTKGIETNLGVESTTTIGGTYAGASFEQQLKLSLSITNKEETQKAQTQSKSASETKNISVTCESGENIGISLTATRKTSSQIGSVSFAPTWGLRFNFTEDLKRNGRGHYHWQFVNHLNDGRKSGNSFYALFPTLNDWIQALEGHSTEWPILPGNMRYHWAGKLTEFLRDSADSKLRWISLDFTANRKFDDAVEITITKFDTDEEARDWIDRHGVPAERVFDHNDAVSYTGSDLCDADELLQIDTASNLLFHVSSYQSEQRLLQMS